MNIELLLTAISVVSVIIPLAAAIRAVSRILFARELVIRDQKGKVLKTITTDSLVRDDPKDLAKFHRDIHSRIKNVERAQAVH